jgi:hypothetical protein
VVDAVPERPAFVSLDTDDEVGVCWIGVPTTAELSVRAVTLIGTSVVDTTVENAGQSGVPGAQELIVVRPVL